MYSSRGCAFSSQSNTATGLLMPLRRAPRRPRVSQPGRAGGGFVPLLRTPGTPPVAGTAPRPAC